MKKPRVYIQMTSCNRLWYVKNFIESFIQCCLEPRRRYTFAMVDNASEEKGLREYLQAQKSAGIIDFLYFKKYRNPPWEQYEAKNILLDRADAPYIWDVQDDFQILRPFTFDEIIEVLEESKKTSTVSLAAGIAEKFSPCVYTKKNHIGYTVVINSSYADQGFYRSSLFDDIGYYKDIWSRDTKQQGSGEAYYQNECRKRGLHVVKLKIPLIHGFKLCAVRGSRRYGDYFKPVNKYYLKIWGKDDIERMNKISGHRIIDEKMISQPDGWDPEKVLYCRGEEIWNFPSTTLYETAVDYKDLLKKDRSHLKPGKAWYFNKMKKERSLLHRAKRKIKALFK
ncbi:MAG: hypothetical protein JW827_05635 [Spirochaetes bacterium]|nr:hypothetical protein [Spirochaetota bacterium]